MCKVGGRPLRRSLRAVHSFTANPAPQRAGRAYNAGHSTAATEQGQGASGWSPAYALVQSARCVWFAMN